MVNEYRAIWGKCKARDLKKAIAFAWFGIGEPWELDETDTEVIGRN